MFCFQLSFGGGSVSRKAGSIASLSGGGDMVYLEVKQKSTAQQQQHPLMKLRRKQWCNGEYSTGLVYS